MRSCPSGMSGARFARLVELITRTPSMESGICAIMLSVPMGILRCMMFIKSGQ